MSRIERNKKQQERKDKRFSMICQIIIVICTMINTALAILTYITIHK